MFVIENKQEIIDFINHRFSKENIAYCKFSPTGVWDSADMYHNIDMTYINDTDDCWVTFVEIAEEIGANWVQYGATKLVFYFDEFPNIVFKIPFLGIGRYMNNELVEDCPFNGTNNSLNNWDYCKTEEEFYDKAIGDNVDDFFCGTTYLCDIYDYPIYISEIAESIHGANVEVSQHSSEKAEEQCYNLDISETYLAWFYEHYDEEEVDNLIDFIRWNDIGDLHPGNLGLVNGQIKIIDYSGYNG